MCPASHNTLSHTHTHRCLCEDTDRCLGCCEPLYVNVWLCGPGSRSGLGPDVCLSVCSFVNIRICISGVMPLNAWNKPLPPRLCVLQINESYLQWQIFENVIQRSCPRCRSEAGSLGVIIPLVPIILSIYIYVYTLYRLWQRIQMSLAVWKVEKISCYFDFKRKFFKLTALELSNYKGKN